MVITITASIVEGYETSAKIQLKLSDRMMIFDTRRYHKDSKPSEDKFKQRISFIHDIREAKTLADLGRGGGFFTLIVQRTGKAGVYGRDNKTPPSTRMASPVI